MKIKGIIISGIIGGGVGYLGSKVINKKPVKPVLSESKIHTSIKAESYDTPKDEFVRKAGK